MNSIVVNLTDKCNLNCIYCFGPQNQDNFISFQKIKDIVKNTDHKYFILTGWEPLLHKDIFEIIKYISEHNKKVILHTNGLLLDQGFVLDVKQYLYRINLPIDSVDQQINSKLRWALHLPKTLQNIELLKANNLKFSITTTLTSINQEKIDHLLTYIQTIKPDLWRIFEYKNINNSLNLDFLKPRNLVEFENKIKKLDIRVEFIKTEDDFYKTFDYLQIW